MLAVETLNSNSSQDELHIASRAKKSTCQIIAKSLNTSEAEHTKQKEVVYSVVNKNMKCYIATESLNISEDKQKRKQQKEPVYGVVHKAKKKSNYHMVTAENIARESYESASSVTPDLCKAVTPVNTEAPHNNGDSENMASECLVNSVDTEALAV